MLGVTLVRNFLEDQARANRAAARAAFMRKVGFTHASGTAAGSKLSRTHRRAMQRARRRAFRQEVVRESQHNPAGSKLIRRTAKAHSGVRMDLAEALEHHARKMTQVPR